jgi:hypothetical protein
LVGEKQSRADRKIEAEGTSESAAADSPDVIDLRPLEDGNGNGAAARGGSETTPDSEGRALTASEGWEWLDLGLRISDAQLDVRRTTSRPMNFDRADVRPRTAVDGAAHPATDRVEPVLEPPADPPGESKEGPATPASGRLTWRDWSNWVRLGRTISDEQDVATPANGEVAAAVSALVAAEPELAEADAEAEPDVAAESDVAEVAEVAEADAEAEPDVEPEADAEPDVEEVADVAEVEAEPAVAEAAEAEAEPDAEPDAEAEPDVAEADAEAEPDVAEVAEVEVESEPDVEPEAEAEPEVEPEVEPDVEQVEDVAEVEVEPDVEEAVPDAEVADIAETDVAADIDATPQFAETAVTEPEVAGPDVAALRYDVAAPAAARTDPHPVTRLTGRPLAVVSAVVIAVVLLVAVIAVALALRDDKPTPGANARPSASAAAPTPAAGKSLAVRWLEQNTAVGTRLLVPPELVDDFAAGLPGSQVLPNDQVAARTGDLLVVTPDSGDVLTGTLTQQVLAAAPVVARLPGSDLEVHQVTGTNPADDAARASAGTELLQNLGLTFVGGASALRSGMVDERVLVILAGLAAQHSLTVALVPDPADAPDALVRTLQIQEVDGQAITAANAPGIKDFVTSQRGALAGPVVNEVDDGTKRQIFVTYLLPASVELLNSGSFPTVSQESP